MRGLIVGTGPSLSRVVDAIPRFEGRIFICNNTWSEPWVWAHYLRTGHRPVWLACDPAWHDHFGRVDHPLLDRWHWNTDICERYGYSYVEGVWHEGLWLKDKTKISLNHCSSAQLLNLALNQYQCHEAVLVGHDFHYPKDGPRHYFSGLSETDGEYPQAIRKFSKFDKGPGQYDLIDVYREISETPDCPQIWNATEGSKLPWFPFRSLEDFCCDKKTITSGA